MRIEMLWITRDSPLVDSLTEVLVYGDLRGWVAKMGNQSLALFETPYGFLLHIDLQVL